ncbi:MAG: hypothetical protein IPO40_12140 [Fibrobacteres bacterium]|nr:hypothetical protein [Fibrobacterota bacterium]
MSKCEDASVASGVTPKPDTTGRWVWGSICFAIFLWLAAAFTPWLNCWLGSRGQVGDFLGGIASPIFGFAGMVLVYRSFQAQLEANRLQIRALEAESDSRKRNDANKYVEDGLRRLEQIFERACYVRRDEGGVKNPYRGVDGIYRFCVDSARGGDPYSENEIMMDVLRHWLLEGGRFLRLTKEQYPGTFEHAASEVSLLYSFTLEKSLKALLSAKPTGAFFHTDLKALEKVKAYFDRAQLGLFEPEEA